MTPNTLFVGGIDMKVDENEIREFFAKYGSVKEVKIITYRGGICKGYGFVYFSEDVDIQTIVDQPISFKGKKLKLGPAIMKERNSRSMSSPMIGPSQWISPTPYMYCSCCPPGLAPPSPVFNGGNQYMQPYSYSSPPGFIVPQVPMNYAQTTYAYQVQSHLATQTLSPATVVWRAEDEACQPELCGLWSPDFAYPSVAFATECFSWVESHGSRREQLDADKAVNFTVL
ncbi:hypothetical protein QQF64_013458 [Cirrhinus molitorella]|uniref:Deleted in azoospermia-like n=1 Tax=Cirrhinus molitorella TaxID=172907 RepID=A0ABR3LR82_9TELE